MQGLRSLQMEQQKVKGLVASAHVLRPSLILRVVRKCGACEYEATTDAKGRRAAETCGLAKDCHGKSPAAGKATLRVVTLHSKGDEKLAEINQYLPQTREESSRGCKIKDLRWPYQKLMRHNESNEFGHTHGCCAKDEWVLEAAEVHHDNGYAAKGSENT